MVLEETKADYLLPQTMREWSSLRPFLISTLDFLDLATTSPAQNCPAPCGLMNKPNSKQRLTCRTAARQSSS